MSRGVFQTTKPNFILPKGEPFPLCKLYILGALISISTIVIIIIIGEIALLEPYP
jgi:hypothetical protein